ncbi:hypothetical protein CYLTODRAFT_409398 [Cylindrobasidium torrendii FP15055 ss-10]|uniref:Uncharacterized protein n=1 Tax=Cylindrobasidium torrendii FP15055 ss-10 TaxID=1314674 RepID=A0A0D7BGX0_9AGAR|nr:hypothetical protein CYLTODRAFT_409398 [Cylindrobasidium torrendii FP15055 ss-10]
MDTAALARLRLRLAQLATGADIQSQIAFLKRLETSKEWLKAFRCHICNDPEALRKDPADREKLIDIRICNFETELTYRFVCSEYPDGEILPTRAEFDEAFDLVHDASLASAAPKHQNASKAVVGQGILQKYCELERKYAELRADSERKFANLENVLDGVLKRHDAAVRREIQRCLRGADPTPTPGRDEGHVTRPRKRLRGEDNLDVEMGSEGFSSDEDAQGNRGAEW